MALGERIKACRQNAGMSQEKVAELVGVSRQAVTKWETGRSAPTTENLLKLAELFDTTVEMMLEPNSGNHRSPAEPIDCPYKMEGEKKFADKKDRAKRNITAASLTVLGYVILYLIGRALWCDLSQSSFIGWLISNRPSGNNSYLYGWLLSSRLFWYAMAISTIPAFFGKHKFSVTTLIAFVVGMLAGIRFGPNSSGAVYQPDDYGWAIWGVIYGLSIIVGFLLERSTKRGTGCSI